MGGKSLPGKFGFSVPKTIVSRGKQIDSNPNRIIEPNKFHYSA